MINKSIYIYIFVGKYYATHDLFRDHTQEILSPPSPSGMMGIGTMVRPGIIRRALILGSMTSGTNHGKIIPSCGRMIMITWMRTMVHLEPRLGGLCYEQFCGLF